MMARRKTSRPVTSPPVAALPPREPSASRVSSENSLLSGDGLPTENGLLTGDCLALLAQVPPESVDLTVTSPPYDNLRQYDTPASLDLLALGKAIFRVTKPGGVCAVIIGDSTNDGAKSLTSFRLALNWCDQAGWRLFECCLYTRHGIPGPWWQYRFRVDHEYIFLFVKGKRPKTFRNERLLIPTKHSGEKVSRRPYARRGMPWGSPPPTVQPWQCRGTVWPYAASSSERNTLKFQHPATMPDKLAADLIQCFSEPVELVLDPLMGSGTSVVMAARLGRRFLGMDVSPAYGEIARERLAREGVPADPPVPADPDP